MYIDVLQTQDIETSQSNNALEGAEHQYGKKKTNQSNKEQREREEKVRKKQEGKSGEDRTGGDLGDSQGGHQKL